MAKSRLPRAPSELHGVRKLFCLNLDCRYRKRKGWPFGTARPKAEKGPFACKHCGEKLEERTSVRDVE